MKYSYFTLQDISGNVRRIFDAQFLQCTKFAKYISFSRGPDTNGIQLNLEDFRAVQKSWVIHVILHSHFVKPGHLLF